jgi:hypothetical protein
MIAGALPSPINLKVQTDFVTLATSAEVFATSANGGGFPTTDNTPAGGQIISCRAQVNMSG